MSAESVAARLHALGYGITINLWAEQEEYVVELWKDGKPACSAYDIDLIVALALAEARLQQGRLAL